MKQTREVVLAKSLEWFFVQGRTTNKNFIVNEGYGSIQLNKENVLEVYEFGIDETNLIEKIKEISPEYFV